MRKKKNAIRNKITVVTERQPGDLERGSQALRPTHVLILFQISHAVNHRRNSKTLESREKSLGVKDGGAPILIVTANMVEPSGAFHAQS